MKISCVLFLNGKIARGRGQEEKQVAICKLSLSRANIWSVEKEREKNQFNPEAGTIKGVTSLHLYALVCTLLALSLMKNQCWPIRVVSVLI